MKPVRISKAAERMMLVLLVGGLAGLIVIGLNPVNATMYRLGLIASMSGVWFGALVLFWRYKGCRIFFLSLPVLLALPFVLPARTMDQSELRGSYVKHMQDFEGTTYHWGGESARGIDCSGLPRRAYRDALLQYGFTHADGGAFRMWLEQWWFDTSAEALGQGYRGFTISLSHGGLIKKMSYDGLMPGDLAVTDSGVHTLVYIGNGQWIQADPGIGSVATLDGRKDDNPWFSQPVSMHRWAVLAY